MFLCDFNKEYELMELARTTLLREKQMKVANSTMTPLMEISNTFAKADYGKDLYEEFDESLFESKLTIDMMYYKHLLENLDQSYGSDVQKTLINTYKLVKDIYEFINIKPEIYGKNVTTKILELSVDEATTRLTSVLNESVNTLFYSLTPEQRLEKYSDKAIPLAKSLIVENNDVEDSLQFSIKTVVMENLLTKIAFPFLAWGRVKHLSENEEFGKIFDQEQLYEMVETFEKNVSVLAKYVAASV